MKIKITEQQLEQVLSELDVNAITKAAQDYGKSEEDSQQKFKDAISKALGGGLNETMLEESLIDYSLIAKIFQHVLSPEQMQFMKDSYEAMNYTSIDHIPTFKTGEIMLFVEYLLYLGGYGLIHNKIKNLASFIHTLVKIGANIARGIAKRVKSGRSAGEVVNEFLEAVQMYSKNDDSEEIIQENLIVSENSRIFAERKFTKRQIYETISKVYEQSSTSKTNN